MGLLQSGFNGLLDGPVPPLAVVQALLAHDLVLPRGEVPAGPINHRQIDGLARCKGRAVDDRPEGVSKRGPGLSVLKHLAEFDRILAAVHHFGGFEWGDG